jgi:hypothetical protein
MAFVNLTPHTITVVDQAGAPALVLPADGTVARVATKTAVAAVVDGVEIFETSFGEVVGLPAPAPGVTWVVSGLVAGHPAVRGRTDVLSPGALVRGPDGQPVGCRGLSRPA